MSKGKLLGTAVRFTILFLAGLVTTLTIFRLRASEAGGPVPSLVATYAHGVLHVTIPYRGAETGSGQLTVEVLDPEDDVVGRPSEISRSMPAQADGKRRFGCRSRWPWRTWFGIACAIALNTTTGKWAPFKVRNLFRRFCADLSCTFLDSSPILPPARRLCE